jgi:hypothetical protein
MTIHSLSLRFRTRCTLLLIALLIIQPLHLTYAEEMELASEEVTTISSEESEETSLAEKTTNEESEEDSIPEEEEEEWVEESASSSEETSTTTEVETTEATSASSSIAAEHDNCTTQAASEERRATSSEDGEEPTTISTSEATSTTDCTVLVNEEATDEPPASLAVSEDAEEIEEATSTALEVEEEQEELTAATTTPSAATGADDGTDATTTITTGNAVATANILNIANTNLVNSEGSIVFSNLTEGASDTIDLRPGATTEATTTGSCSIESCEGNQGINVNLNNDAHIDNLIDVNATSGENIIENADHAVIESGDAYTALNLVNIANVNFIDSHYMLVALNSFGNVTGDIVFPSLDSFFTTETSSPSGVDLGNTATITNDVIVNTNAGNNETGAVDQSTIQAGAAHTFSNIFNQINTTLGVNDNVSILLRVHGVWNGGLENAPPQLSIAEGADGTHHITSASTTWTENASSTEGDELEGAIITSSSSAHIHNQVRMNAVSGGNVIWNAESALITSGNAYAGANLINIANANVIGRNWLLGIVNIFGDFNGNIAFGRPDLWIGARTEISSPPTSGSELVYTFTIMNNGDAPVTDIALFDTVDLSYFEILESSLPYATTTSEQLLWNIGKLTPGASKELTLKVRIKDVAPGTILTHELTVRGKETDNNTVDNKERISISTYVPPSVGGSSGTTDNSPISLNGNQNTTSTTTSTKQLLPLEIIRSTATTTIPTADTKSAQEITIKNPNTESLPAVILKDTLRDPSGNVIHNEEWDLGTILPNEEINLGYDIAFSENATSGTYILSSTVSRPNTVDTVFQANGMIFLSHEAKREPALSEELMEPMIFERIQEEATSPSVPAALTTTSNTGEILGTSTAAGDTFTETIIESMAPATAYAQGSSFVGDISDPRNKLKYTFVVVLLVLLIMSMYDRVSAYSKK